ncbi:MAG: hypothetical protein AB8H86_03545 [Polyangiales bacterium]
MIRWLLSLAVLMTVASCGESGTFVLLDIEYGDLDDVDELQITGVAADGTQLGMNVTGRVSRARIQLPDNTAGEVTLRVTALSDGGRLGYGQDRVSVRALEENSAQVLLRALGECSIECESGTQRCEDGRISTCDLNGDGCFEWSPAEACPARETTCSGEGLLRFEAFCDAGECGEREVRTVCDCQGGICIGGCDLESCDDPGLCRTTDGVRCGADGCEYPADVGADCDDGRFCTEDDACSLAGECVGTTVCPTPEPECNDAGTALITSMGGMCSIDGCVWETQEETCDCAEGACVTVCFPRWTQTLIDMGDLNARLAIAPGGQVHLAQLRGGDVYHSSPPAFPGRLAAAGVVDFDFHMTSDGIPHIFAQDDVNAVRHYYLDGTWITDGTQLSDAISFAIAVTPGDYFDYYYRSSSPGLGIRFRQCTTQPNCTWTGDDDGTEVAGIGVPVDAVAISDTTSQVLMREGGMTYIAERTTPTDWLPFAIATQALESGALAIGATGPEYAFRVGGVVSHAVPPLLSTMLASNAINNVDMASNGEHTFVAWRAATSAGMTITNASTGMDVYDVRSAAGSAWLPQIEFDESGGAHVLYHGVGDVLVYATSPCL